ncbi:LytR/AlgR family response regulator transcription factor [Flavobacterium sp. UBA7682]|uniref:LytR/AlgR family response regulator transcription factor n=1 Tax=Flavobacterium sp. UBA7682 TaxID=1946560 RepID=UPI0025C1BF91|nr:LytTR family DNA-binding domain-containing protein [Flavobacterium sp. UBA7682]
MISYRCIIIEDEPLALDRLKEYVLKVPFLSLIGFFDNALDGLTFLKSNSIDLLFLDINMDELSGIELLESTQVDCEVILTTAYQEYALKGYELNVSDYLLKPYTFNRFLQAVNRVQEKLSLKHSEHRFEFIFVKTENRLEKINISDIIYIEGMRDYRRIHTSSKKIMTLQNFGEFEQIIASNILCRVHKSYMVAINKIDTVERSRINIGGVIIPVSETYRELFFKTINSKM